MYFKKSIQEMRDSLIADPGYEHTLLLEGEDIEDGPAFFDIVHVKKNDDELAERTNIATFRLKESFFGWVLYSDKVHVPKEKRYAFSLRRRDGRNRLLANAKDFARYASRETGIDVTDSTEFI